MALDENTKRLLAHALASNVAADNIENSFDNIKVYDDATARDADIPSPSTGDTVYLKDIEALMTYDGSSWSTPGTTVLSYDDATARDADLTSPASGMMVYLSDTKALSIYTGGAWVTAPAFFTDGAGFLGTYPHVA